MQSTLATMLRDRGADNVQICNESVVMKVHVPHLGVYTISVTPILDATTGKTTFLNGMKEHCYTRSDDALAAVQQCMVIHDACFSHAFLPPGLKK